MKTKPSLMGRIRHTLGREQTGLVFLAAAYFLTGKAGLAFGYLNPAVTVLFPPPGLALGAFLVLGYRVWPVVLLAPLLLYASVLGAVACRADSRRRATPLKVCSART